MLIQMVRFPSFIRLNNVSWYVSAVFSFFNVRLLMEIWLVSVSWLGELQCSENGEQLCLGSCLWGPCTPHRG